MPNRSSPESTPLQTPNRFYSLDALRGLAALAVVFWHWRHFFYNGLNIGDHDPDRFPFRSIFEILYSRGWLSVDLFFCLSGFIFFWLYADAIRRREITASRFSLLRFSRLYPLHLLTIGVVIIAQFYLQLTAGQTFVYGNFDLPHLVPNLLGISSWLFHAESPTDYSFNGPAWSVSVELLLYILFFLWCRNRSSGVKAVATVALLGVLFLHLFHWAILRGIAAFFCGGVVYFIYQHCLARSDIQKLIRVSTIVVPVIWVSTILLFPVKTELLNWLFSSSIAGVISDCLKLWPTLVLFPLTILGLALIETGRGHFGKRFAVLGDISYSTYLIHFPLQLVFHIVAVRLSLSTDLFYSPLAMILFFALLIMLGMFSHYQFERPIQKLIRTRFR